MQVQSKTLEVRASTHDWEDMIQFITVLWCSTCRVKCGVLCRETWGHGLNRAESCFLTGKAGTITTYPMGLWRNERP